MEGAVENTTQLRHNQNSLNFIYEINRCRSVITQKHINEDIRIFYIFFTIHTLDFSVDSNQMGVLSRE